MKSASSYMKNYCHFKKHDKEYNNSLKCDHRFASAPHHNTLNLNVRFKGKLT